MVVVHTLILGVMVLDENNIIIKEVGTTPTLMKGAKPHWELTSDYSLIDFELGNKLQVLDFLFTPIKEQSYKEH